MPTNNAALFGIGRGSAQVIDNSGTENAYGQVLAQQQAKRQQELKQLTDQQAQLKPDGLRNDADRQDFFNQANDWRQKAISATNEHDPYKKSLLQSQAQQAYLQAQQTVSQSKQQAAKDNAFQQFAMNDSTRHQLTDDAVQQGLSNANVGVNDPKIIKDYSTLQRQVDHKKIMGELDDDDQGLLKQTAWDTPTLTRQKVGNRMATFINNSRTIDPADRADMIAKKYDVRPDIKQFFNDINPDIYNNPQLTDQQKRDAAIAKYVKDTGDVSEYHAPVEKVDTQPDRFYEHYNYELAHPRPNVAIGNAPTPAQTLITDMQKGAAGSGEKLLSLVPKGQYGSQKPVIGLDPRTGEHLFNFPAQITPDKKAIAKNAQLRADAKLDGSAVDPNELLPETITNKPQKQYRLNPASTTYISDAAQMAKDQNINLSQLNQIEGIKGGHGQIPQVKTPPVTPHSKKVTDVSNIFKQ